MEGVGVVHHERERKEARAAALLRPPAATNVAAAAAAATARALCLAGELARLFRVALVVAAALSFNRGPGLPVGDIAGELESVLLQPAPEGRLGLLHPVPLRSARGSVRFPLHFFIMHIVQHTFARYCISSTPCIRYST